VILSKKNCETFWIGLLIPNGVLFSFCDVRFEPPETKEEVTSGDLKKARDTLLIKASHLLMHPLSYIYCSCIIAGFIKCMSFIYYVGG
jgi:hypothetical protein